MDNQSQILITTAADLATWRQEVREALDQYNHWQTLGLVARGFDNRKVGDALYISSAAVKSRLQVITDRVFLLAPRIGVEEVNRTGLATVYRYASFGGCCPPSRAWRAEVMQALRSASKRQMVLAQLPLGLSNAQIGRRCKLAESTVKTHLDRLRGSLQPFAADAGIYHLSRTGLASIALLTGVTATARVQQ